MAVDYKRFSVLLVVVFIRAHVIVSNPTESSEQKLFTTLLSSAYNKNARPVENSSKPMIVSFGLRMGQLVRLDNKKQSLTATVWVTQKWKNPYLRWKPSRYGGVDTVHLPPTDIWVPDTVLYNNADEGTPMAGYLAKFQTKVMVNSKGRCTWMAPATFTSSCGIDVKHWPFDTQKCSMTFGSWSYGDRFLVYRTGETDTLDDVSTKLADDFLNNGEWTVDRIKSGKNVKLYPCCTAPFSHVTVIMKLTRKPLYHIMHLIIPIAILGVLTLVNFGIPSESGERIGYVMTILLAMSVYLLLLGDTLPKTSDVVPLLGIFVVMTMATIFLSLLATVAALKLYHKEGTPPKWLSRFLRTFCCKEAICCKKNTRAKLRAESKNVEGTREVNENVNHNLRGILKNKMVEENPQMTWQDVSILLDRMFFFLFLIIPLVIYAAFGVISYKQKSLLEA